MKNIILTVGCPGSGKSTWIKNSYNLIDKTVIRINADAIRYMLYGDETIQGNGSVVFKIVYSLFKDALFDTSVDTIIIDNTNINYKSRKNFYDLITQYDLWSVCNIQLVIFDDHVKSFIQNDSRKNIVPEEVMIRMQSNFETINTIELGMGIKTISAYK